MAARVHRATVCVISNDDCRESHFETDLAGAPPLAWTVASPEVPSLQPAILASWTFCLPARPAPNAAGDAAWLVFLGADAAPVPAPAEPWQAWLTR